MRILNHFIFFDGEIESGASDNNLSHSAGDKLVLQVTDASTEGTYKINIEGKTNDALGASDGWFSLFTTNVTTNASSVDITADGIYTATVSGINQIRCNIVTISGAEVTVFAKLLG